MGNKVMTTTMMMMIMMIYLFICLFINSGIEFNTSTTHIQDSQQQQYKPEKERKGYK